MNVHLAEVSKFGVLSNNALNLFTDLKDKGVYIKSAKTYFSINSFLDEISNKEDNFVLYLSELEYVNFLKFKSEVLTENNGVFYLDKAVIFPVISDKNYFTCIDKIISFNKNTNLTVYKLFDVQYSKVKAFFEKLEISFSFDTDGLETRLSFDISNLTEEKRWEFLKNFVLEFNDYIYSETDNSLAEELVKILKIRGIMLSCAESFTAGGIASYITSVSGASSVFYESVVAYDEQSKQNRLGVLKNTLLLKRPVSSQTAYEMCLGALENADVALSSTGLAGPLSDGSGLPVGLVFIGVGSKEKISMFKYKFSGSRKDITNRGVKTAVFLLIKALRSGSLNV
ncbi:MAG: CinA family protein [Clostridia bacterium]|nr:CinA family protein [Clostridia bacterium]